MNHLLIRLDQVGAAREVSSVCRDDTTRKTGATREA